MSYGVGVINKLNTVENRIFYYATKIAEKSSINKILLYILIMHSILFIYDIKNETIFLNGDSGPERLNAIKGFIKAFETNDLQTLIEFIVTNNRIGDYIFHTFFYYIGGKHFTLLMQVILAVISYFCLYKIFLEMLKKEALSLIGTVIYIFLPHSIIIPHLLMSESIFNPFIIISIYILLKIRNANKFGVSYSVFCGLLYGSSCLIRPTPIPYIILLPIPIIFSHLCARKKILYSSIIIIVSLSLVLSWVLLVKLYTGKLSYGQTAHGITINIIGKLNRYEGVYYGQPNFNYYNNEISIGLIYGIISKNKMNFLKSTISDLSSYYINSGINKLLLQYFNVFEGSKLKNGRGTSALNWYKISDSQGLYQAILHLLKNAALFTIINIIFSLLWLYILIRSIYESIKIIQNHTEANIIPKFFLIPFFYYMMAVSMLAGSIRSCHRSPIEFLIIIFFISSFSRTLTSEKMNGCS
jgi:4-amino-4-deoxy-L-arabinose transferase-like glycosyltransferase